MVGSLLQLHDELLLFSGISSPAPPSPTGLYAVTVAGPQVNLYWSLNGIADATDLSIERRDMTAGEAFSELVALGSGVAELYEGDVGPFTEKHTYAYRVKIVGGASAGFYTNEIRVFATPSGHGRRRRIVGTH